MARGLNFEGKTVEDAADEACKQLDIQKEDLKYDVLSYGSTGIFGLVGTKKARIRVTVSGEESGEERAKEPSGDTPQTEDSFQSAPMETERAEGVSEVLDEQIGLCREVVQRIVDTITMEAEILVEKNEDKIQFQIKGGNAAVLIGKRGQTLEAIQYLVEKIANKQIDPSVRIQVDVEGYLRTRQDNLERLSARLAQKAVRMGKPMTIGQMNPHDRRIVHLALKNDTSVRTQSMGDGLYRKLIIFPKRKGREKKVSSSSSEEHA